MSGVLFDGPVMGATIEAFLVSSAGVVGTTPIAEATTDVNGNYNLTIPAADAGQTVLLTSVGGTYVDDVTGQTVQAGPLSVLIPSATAGTQTEEMTPLTSLAAQLALQVSAATGVSPATVAALLNSEVGMYFGGLTNITGTPLVNVNTANCASSASQASVDTSLILAGLAQIAQNNGVTTAALIAALIEDFASDGQFDGTANGTPITVPLANGTGSVSLSTIENSAGGLPQTVAAAITAFEASTANVCTAQISTPVKTALAAGVTAFPAPPGAELITVSGNISGLNNSASVALRVKTTGLVNTSPDAEGQTGFCADGNCPGVSYKITGTGAFGPTSAGAPDAGFTGYNMSILVSDPQNESCGLALPDTGSVTPNTPVNITGISISCGVRNYPISVLVSGLTSGQSVVMQNEGSNATTATANQVYTFTSETFGSAYAVTIETQPTSETCTLPSNASGTIDGGVTVYVSCGSTTTTGILSNPNALLLSPDQTLLYVANPGGNQVLVYNVVRNTSGLVTALNLSTQITGADIEAPGRLAFDTTGEFLYVTNNSASAGWVSVYDTFNSNAEVTADKIIGGSIGRTLGVAVDSNGIVYIGDNNTNQISVFQPKSGGGFQEASFSPITQDAAGNSFFAPGAISYYGVVGGDFLLIGGEGISHLYSAPFTKSSTPLYTLSNVGCSSAPSGVTGYALRVGGISVGQYSDSSLFISDYYGGNVADYSLAGFFQTGTCPTPTKTAAISNSYPEGVAIDAFGNLFVSYSGLNQISVYSGPYTGSPLLSVH